MKKYSIDIAEAEFREQITITETTDTNHADNINAAPKQVYENTLANRRELQDLKKNILPVVFSTTPPDHGPALWFCTGKWPPESEVKVTFVLGDDEDMENATVFAEIEGTRFPIINASRDTPGDDEVVVTVDQSQS